MNLGGSEPCKATGVIQEDGYHQVALYKQIAVVCSGYSVTVGFFSVYMM